MNPSAGEPDVPGDHYTTREAARLLGMAVRSIQMMVDRGELEAWKTPGGHRRISRRSVELWRQAKQATGAAPPSTRPEAGPPRVLLIEDSVHYQRLMTLLLHQHFPQVELHVAADGITGLAMYGQLQPQVLIIDILLPGIDGATLITTLRSHAQFRRSRLIVVTSLTQADRAPYAFALAGVPVVHKLQAVAELPPLLAQCLASLASGGEAG